jgi:hypothetical protein
MGPAGCIQSFDGGVLIVLDRISTRPEPFVVQNGGGGEHRPWLVDTNETTFVTDVRCFVSTYQPLVFIIYTIDLPQLC